MSVFANIKTFITTKVWPFIETLGKVAVNAEINAFEPKAAAVVSKAVSIIQNATSTKEMGQALAKLIIDSTEQAANDAVIVGASAILAGLGTALNSNPHTADNLGVTTALPVSKEAMPAS